MPDTTLFFWQSYGYVGNSINFWAAGMSGYTTNPHKAHVFTKDQTINQMRCNRSQDRFWLYTDIITAITPHVDMQNVKAYSL